MPSSRDDDGVIIEYTSFGHTVKVTAIDPGTGKEVSIIGAAQAGQHELAKLAVRKLHYVLNKEK